MKINCKIPVKLPVIGANHTKPCGKDATRTVKFSGGVGETIDVAVCETHGVEIENLEAKLKKGRKIYDN